MTPISSRNAVPQPEVVKCPLYLVLRTHQSLGRVWHPGELIMFNHEPPSEFKRHAEDVGFRKARMIPTDEIQFEYVGRRARVSEQAQGKEYMGEITDQPIYKGDDHQVVGHSTGRRH